MPTILNNYTLQNGNTLDLDGSLITLTGTAELDGTVQGDGTLVVAAGASAALNGLVLQDGAVFDIAGTVDQTGYAQFGVTSTDALQITIAAGGVYDLTADNSTNNSNSNDDGTATITNAGLLEKTAGTATSAIFTNLVNTGTILVASGVLDLESIGTSTLDGTVTGTGVLVLGRDGFLLDTAVLNVPTLDVASNLTLEEDLTYTGVFTQSGGTVGLNGHTLVLSGTAALDGDFAGAGTLVVAAGASAALNGLVLQDGAVFDIAGTVDQTGYAQFGVTSTDALQITIAAGGVYDLTADNSTNNSNSNDDGDATITNAGLLEKTAGTATSAIFTNLVNTGTILVASGVLDLESIGTSTLDGTVTGTGVLVLGRDGFLLDTAVLNVPTLDVASNLTLEEDLTYTGVFTQSGGTVGLNGHTLVLSGTAALDGDFAGAGTLVVAAGASAALNGLVLQDGAVFDIAGTVDQTGYAQFGVTSTDALQITIAAGGVYDLTADNSTNNSNSNDDGDATITNAGLLEKTAGTATSAIFTNLVNTGTILVASGVLDLESIGTSTLDGTVTGTGVLVLGRDGFLLDTAVLNVPTLDVASNLTLEEDLTYTGVFTQSGGTVGLNGHTLVLSGTAALDGDFAGAGTLVVAAGASAALNGLVLQDGAVFDIAGTVDQTGYAQFGVTSTDALQITIAAGGVYDLTADNSTNNSNSNDDGDATITNAGLLEKTAGTGTSAIFTNLVNTGTILVASGELDLAGTVSGNGMLETQGGTVLELNGSVLTGQTVNFLGGSSLLLGDAAQFQGTIADFTSADTIDLTGFAASSDTYVTGTGLILNGGALTLDIAGDFTTANFSLTSDGGSGTLIEEVTCFAEGTRIATARGEVAVEALKIGDKVRTLHAGLQPVKWIGTRSYVAPFANHAKVLPVCIKAGAIGDGVPARDLHVSPGHAICIDDALIHAARLVNGVNITQAKRIVSIIYYHIELENHEVIFAENCPAETFVGEYFRKVFHNAAEHARLYPGQGAPEHICLPQLTSGLHLAAIQRRLAARAGIAGVDTAGPLRGYIDHLSPTLVVGWAQNLSHPENAVYLDIFVGTTRVGRVLANLYRADVQAAGFGSGHHGFEFSLPADAAGRITVSASGDGSMLGLAEGTVQLAA